MSSLARPALVLATGLTALVTVVPSALPAAAWGGAVAEATRLQTQHLRSALGIDDTTPDLTWQPTGHGRGVVQSAYRIQAATSRDRLEHGRPDLWDSGKVGPPSRAPSTRARRSARATASTGAFSCGPVPAPPSGATSASSRRA